MHTAAHGSYSAYVDTPDTHSHELYPPVAHNNNLIRQKIHCSPVALTSNGPPPQNEPTATFQASPNDEKARFNHFPPGPGCVEIGQWRRSPQL